MRRNQDLDCALATRPGAVTAGAGGAVARDPSHQNGVPREPVPRRASRRWALVPSHIPMIAHTFPWAGASSVHDEVDEAASTEQLKAVRSVIEVSLTSTPGTRHQVACAGCSYPETVMFDGFEPFPARKPGHCQVHGPGNGTSRRCAGPRIWFRLNSRCLTRSPSSAPEVSVPGN